jgi:HEPN domain-containing protein
MNNYKDLALYDMKSAKANYEHGLWNKVGKECQQACEKYIKYYFETSYPGDDFIELDKEMADEAIKIAESLMAYINNLPPVMLDNT